MKYKSSTLLIILALLTNISCENTKTKENQEAYDTLFTKIPAELTGIKFINTVKETEDFHPFNYPYIYNGGGVAIGDINNDGLDDIYFTANQTSNKLYLNKGDLQFEDITDKAGVTDAQGWTTGVSMIDINDDGWLDLYVCKSASRNEPELRKNLLFVNQQNGTFKEEATRWGIHDDGFSVQSYFLDYDKDGDLDLFLINHRDDFFNSIDLDALLADKDYFPQTSDHLYRNDGTFFTDVTLESGIINKEYSLSASIGDFNNDGWPDIFVANDFITPDKLYLNKRDGTFSNQINTRVKHTSYSSMGSDYADINNDFLPDLLVLDMSAEDHQRGKQNMPSMDTNGFLKTALSGYHYAYMSNVLNLNNGNGYFSDIAQYAGVAKTDWSWAPLLADFDQDGYKDIFISNGIKRELGNQDFGNLIHNSGKFNVGETPIAKILEQLPSNKLKNYAYRNKSQLAFENAITAWGFEEAVNSNGAAYSDLDNDGDLDLVLNNMDAEASVYRNNSTANFLSVKLTGPGKNSSALGATVRIYTDSLQQEQQLYLSRGFQSSVSPTLVFGLGPEEQINRIEVAWGDGKVYTEEYLDANQFLEINYADSNPMSKAQDQSLPAAWKSVNPKSLGLNYAHREKYYNDFDRQVLLPQKQSQKGPAFAAADLNNDGLEDWFIGGARDQAGIIYFREQSGAFKTVSQPALEADKKHEDQGAVFFDADKDGDLDLYVTSGAYEFDENDTLLQDRLYLNDGSGNFSKTNILPEMLTNTKAVVAYDYDADGDQDLIVGGHVVPGKYPLSARSYILKNNNGRFTDVTPEIAPQFENLGIVNELLISDYDGDGQGELIAVGEWMSIHFFDFKDSKFVKKEIDALKNTSGWWNTIAETDFDGDGDLDYFVGNLGGNNKFHPTPEKPLFIFGSNFDDDKTYDMVLSKTYQGNLVPVRGKECSTAQNAFVSEKIKTFKEFANSSMEDIYGTVELSNSYRQEVVEFRSVYLENTGNGNFSLKYLPAIAQLGPTMSFAFVDVNADGFTDVVGAGGIYEAEVETVRYDANVGYILLNDTKGNFKPYKDRNFYTGANTRYIHPFFVNTEKYLLVTNNDRPLSVFKY
ncbi:MULTISPECIES: VCBS repeat-containing protein [unclassified Leeuwenhoekiella]|uniref:VCBS repeat-containing protein n=1 Tax=unclassified Leeuwenhoekiella TaxID=2615029 RepID=UPI000C5C14B7|nr:MULTISPECIES: VCBS repeat-containing protein [unclassified Leeuwenhoekiella]MBA83054.1 RNA-binding protein [Leeuwenhoekiella sp.]|tara:strand:- start:22278 stop:25565 length:3288 start_codon:yes stop_codon:yes gene_type:complete